MLALMVIMILVIVLGGLASYQMFMINQTQNLVIQSQKNQSSVAMWKSLLISKAKAVGENNELVLPIGENKVDYHTVPSWLYFNTKNPWGKDFVYCPFGPISTGVLSQDVSLSLSTNYQVRTVSNFATKINGGNREYVVASSPNGIRTDILAFIISPLPSSTNTLPNCANVVFDSTLNAYKVDNGLVDVITKGDVETFANLSLLSGQNNGQNNTINYINTIEGDSSIEGNTLNNNFNYISASDFSYIKLNLPPSESNIDDINFNSGNDEYKDGIRTFILEGDSSGNSVINSASSSNLIFNNYRVILKNVKLKENIVPIFYNSTLITENVEISNVVLRESKWKVDGDNDIVRKSNNMPFTDTAAIILYKSELFIPAQKNLKVEEHSNNKYTIGSEKSSIILETGTLNIEKSNNLNTIELVDSVLSLRDDSVLNVSSAASYNSDLTIDEFSKVSLMDSVINSGYAKYSFINKGYTVFKNSSLNTYSSNVTAGILLQSNANLVLKSSSPSKITNIGYSSTPANRPKYAIADDLIDGGTFIGGSGVNGGSINLYSKDYCAAGPMFKITKETLNIAPYTTENNYASVSQEIGLFARKLNASNFNCIK